MISPGPIWIAGRGEYMAAVEVGEQLFHGGPSGSNTVSCDLCHPNAANVHPETYP